ncbi:hypothetical protein [Escherichia coli]|uniref:hypothetical protein n=1 Tax=Escherichia coli TaxID=562 RepID=UPI001CDAA52B|nr:hypothetical protein [Escherichia coli]
MKKSIYFILCPVLSLYCGMTMAVTPPPASTIPSSTTAFAEGEIEITNNCRVTITTPRKIVRPATEAPQADNVTFTITQNQSCADIGSRIAYWSEGSQSVFRMVNKSNPSLFYSFTNFSEAPATTTLTGSKQYSLANKKVKSVTVSIPIPKSGVYVPGHYTLGLNAGLVIN